MLSVAIAIYILWDGRHHLEVKVLENGIENLVDYMVITI